MFRLFNFIKRYGFRHPIYIVVYAKFFLMKRCIFNIHLYSVEEIKTKIKNGQSIIRLGDGEINILLSLSNHYQKFSPVLQQMLQKIISEYSEKSPYILAIPKFVTVSNLELKQINKFNVWLPLKVMFFLKFKKNVGYFDAHSFYYDNYFESVVGPYLTDKQVVLVTKKATIEVQAQNQNIPWKNFSFVEVPESDALSTYENIKLKIETHIQQFESSKTVLLFALGPVGKYLTYSFAHQGIQSLDIGKVAEVMYNNVSLEYLI